jgi:hypothetical protein
MIIPKSLRFSQVVCLFSGQTEYSLIATTVSLRRLQ